MELKRGNKVKYLGGEVVFGTKEGTDELHTLNMHPIDGVYNPQVEFTYIHYVIESSQDGNLYIIPHHEGVPKEFFLVNEVVFGKLDLTELKELDRKGNLMKYIYVSEDDLVLIPKIESTPSVKEINNKISKGVESEDIPNLNKATISEEKSSTEPLDSSFTLLKEEIVEEDIPENVVTNDNLETSSSSIQEPKLDYMTPVDEVVEEISKESTDFISSNTASTGSEESEIKKTLYTYQNFPKDGVTFVVPKQDIIRGVKINKPFTIELESGEMEQGKSGDVLMITKDDKLFIEKKEDITGRYDHIDDVKKITLEGDDKEYIVSEEVFNRFNELKGYITELEDLNKEIREKLHLKYPNETVG